MTPLLAGVSYHGEALATPAAAGQRRQIAHQQVEIWPVTVRRRAFSKRSMAARVSVS